MNTIRLHAVPDGKKTVLERNKRWKPILRRTLLAAIIAPIVIAPAMVSAVVAVVTGAPIPVAVNGTVGAAGDTVDISGQITVTTRIIPDPDFGSPNNLELIVDFSNVKGNGKGNGTSKFATEAQTVIHRPLLALDPIEVTFPYTQGNNVNSTKTAVATLMVSFNASTGVAITSTVKDVPMN
jgi:hypothetical protein